MHQTTMRLSKSHTVVDSAELNPRCLDNMIFKVSASTKFSEREIGADLHVRRCRLGFQESAQNLSAMAAMWK